MIPLIKEMLNYLINQMRVFSHQFYQQIYGLFANFLFM